LRVLRAHCPIETALRRPPVGPVSTLLRPAAKERLVCASGWRCCVEPRRPHAAGQPGRLSLALRNDGPGHLRIRRRRTLVGGRTPGGVRRPATAEVRGRRDLTMASTAPASQAPELKIQLLGRFLARSPRGPSRAQRPRAPPPVGWDLRMIGKRSSLSHWRRSGPRRQRRRHPQRALPKRRRASSFSSAANKETGRLTAACGGKERGQAAAVRRHLRRAVRAR
jgi:hypothetical protein